MSKTADNKPWERLKGESEKAFEAFVLYRDLGSGRSIRKVVQELNKSVALLGRWSSIYNWCERVREYDNELEQAAREQAIKARRDMTERNIRIAVRLQKKALAALEKTSAEDMSPNDIIKYLKMATELERLNREPAEAEKDDVIYETELEDMDGIEREIYEHD